MPAAFQNVRFHAAEKLPSASARRGFSPAAFRGEPSGATQGFNDDESAARFYVERLFQQDERPGLRGLTAPERPEIVPDLQLVSRKEMPQSATTLMRFNQTKAAIPIFGSNVVVELDKNRELVSLDADVAEVGNVSPLEIGRASCRERV